MGKFIIEKEDKEAVYLMYADEDGDVMVEGAYLTPYIEPDREKAAARCLSARIRTCKARVCGLQED